MSTWQFIHKYLAQQQPVLLLYVLSSEGSSPGRQGFNMAVASDGLFDGTIGGGIMEFKLVEKAKMLLAQGKQEVLLMWQYHDKTHSDQSGMICSGNQLNAFIPLSIKDLPAVEAILLSLKNGTQQVITLSPQGLALGTDNSTLLPSLQLQSESNWLYRECINKESVIHIIGGGHVGLALSEMMAFLGFYVIIYDSRADLTTLEQNTFAKEKRIVDYACIGNIFNDKQNDYVAIMTVGYRTDKIVLQQLLGKTFAYIGLMGSQNKIKTLLAELLAEGYSKESLSHIFTPIGLNIYSRTTREIAVSIAAEIIREKNKGLPTGRK
ncbi:XdhC family protein [Parasediminibacterium sp. JCM 36343]|uniref:XdhC family protein n=1 Tax=Parasediminibacterium sp. JCM 36343 TaxID=3374279 RepID=UPI00397CD1C4